MDFQNQPSADVRNKPALQHMATDMLIWSGNGDCMVQPNLALPLQLSLTTFASTLLVLVTMLTRDVPLLLPQQIQSKSQQ